ncbi:restriction endonuclease subunit S [Avibacterium paragallinarum]|uniref:restriction endonuclease subunit S n=2 Tax=Avibacterium paragallinarum TaxID=728 RepID=UPI0013EE8ED6|nr:restriction endonuclease subunit S [Avibacterium paragallinarum]
MDTAKAIFNESSLKQSYDQNILEAYLKYIEMPSETYHKLRQRQLTWQEIQEAQNEYLVAYRTTILDKISLNRTEEKQNPETTQQQNLKMRKFFDEFSKLEQEKIALFTLLYQQKTLVITAPSDNAKQKIFLGYDWSNRKGAEGIQIQTAGGKLYNDQDRFASNTLAACVREMFTENNASIGEEQKEYATILNTVDMLDFSNINFNYAIRTSMQKKVEVVSKYPLVRLGEVAEIISGQSPESRYYNELGEGLLFYQGKKDFGFIYLEKINIYTSSITKRSTKDDILMSVRAPVGDVNINPFDEICIGRGLAAIRPKLDVIKQRYLFAFIQGNKDLFQGKQGMAFSSISRSELENQKIPLPSLEIQQQIVTECEKIDEEYENSRMKIEEYRAKIAKIFNELEIVRGGVKRFKINELSNILMCRRVMKHQTNSVSGVPFYKIGTFGSKVNAFISLELYEEYKEKYPYPKKGQVLISAAGTLGKTVIFDGKPAYFQDSNIVWLDSNENIINNLFLYYALQTVDWKKYSTEGSVIPRIYNNNLGNVEIPVPDLATQEKIISEVSEIEAKIAELQTQMADTEAKKKAILNQYLL